MFNTKNQVIFTKFCVCWHFSHGMINYTNGKINAVTGHGNEKPAHIVTTLAGKVTINFNHYENYEQVIVFVSASRGGRRVPMQAGQRHGLPGWCA